MLMISTMSESLYMCVSVWVRVNVRVCVYLEKGEWGATCQDLNLNRLPLSPSCSLFTVIHVIVWTKDCTNTHNHSAIKQHISLMHQAINNWADRLQATTGPDLKCPVYISIPSSAAPNQRWPLKTKLDPSPSLLLVFSSPLLRQPFVISSRVS